jgi:hypothetical protein
VDTLNGSALRQRWAALQAPALVTSFVVVGAVNVGGVAKSSSIEALVCSAELIVSI